MRYGIQLFGINSIFSNDKEGVLLRFKNSGFRYLEPCLDLVGIPQLSDNVWSEDDFKKNYPLLEYYGFSINSCHVFSLSLIKDVPKLIEHAGKYGIKQYVVSVPSLQMLGHTGNPEDCDLPEIYTNYISEIKKVGQLLRESGIQLLIHNSKDESVLRVGKISLYEWILHQVKGFVGAQPDTGWLIYGGTDPEGFLWRNKEQILSLHYKDMKKISEDISDEEIMNPSFDGLTNPVLTETGIGRGLTDMTACFQFAREIEIIQYMDQDKSDGDFLCDVEFVGEMLQSLTQARDNSRSILCTMDIETGEVTRLHEFDRVIEAPNWYHKDEDYLYYNSGGRIYKYSISKDEETLVDTGKCINCNNDHVISPDGNYMAVSHSDTGWMSQIYVFPIDGGIPRLITPLYPSFLHGWSPDGNALSYCAFRGGWDDLHVDIYTIPVGCADENYQSDASVGRETQLTKNAGFNDGPEFSPNNEEIWFTSTRTGLMQIWKMNRDGTNQIQMSFTERNNWFPHISPDCSKVVYLSFSKDGLDPNEHLPNMNVQLRYMNPDGSDDHKILDFYGGQGSINVNSWAPDSRRFAFVMYELCHN